MARRKISKSKPEQSESLGLVEYPDQEPSAFATMLGEKEPTQGVAEACAELLIPEKT